MIEATRKVLISAPKERVSEYLRDFSRLSEYEQKVDACLVSHSDPETAVAEVSGRYFGLPFKAAFRMTHTRDGGYSSELLRGPFKSGRAGYRLQAVTGGTVLTHDEQYHVPLAFKFKPLRRVMERWLGRTMDVELAVIKEGAERLHRRRLVEEIDKDVDLDR